MKKNLVVLGLLIIGLFVFSGCGLIKQGGVILTITASPNPVTGTISADGKQENWEFTLTYRNGNNSEAVLVYAGTYEMKNSSNVIMSSGELPFNSFNISAGGSATQTWTFHSGSINNHPAFTSGSIKMSFTGKTTDSDPYISWVTENIQ